MTRDVVLRLHPDPTAAAGAAVRAIVRRLWEAARSSRRWERWLDRV